MEVKMGSRGIDFGGQLLASSYVGKNDTQKISSRISWNSSFKPIQFLGPRALVKCNYPVQGPYQLHVSLSDCFSTGQPRDVNWFEAFAGGGKVIPKRRRGRCDIKGTGRNLWNQIVLTWKFSPHHGWPLATGFHPISAFSSPHSPFQLKDPQQ